DVASGNCAKQCRARRPQFLGRREIACGRGACHVERALARKDAEVRDGHIARGVTEADHEAARAQAIERALEGRLADTVVDDIDAFPAGEFPDPGGEVLGAVVDDLVAAIGLCQRYLLVRTGGAVDGGAQAVSPVAGYEPDAAGSGMPQDAVARLYLPGEVKQ